MIFEYKNKCYELASLNSLDNKFNYDIVVILQNTYYLYDSEKMKDVEITKKQYEEYTKDINCCVSSNFELVNFFYGLSSYDDEEMLKIAKEMIDFTCKEETQKNTYMDVKELNNEQLEKLKQKVYYMNFEELEEEFGDVLNDDIVLELEKANFYQDISNETIYTLFSGISFVEEDF